ncbi:uncharacterized protein G2W53_029709 [Senna tora]|uniref:Uncharacterized protein n=1 Tax=Senna tora TaxID=362788 RepID=A0A834T590_9FABA|nr:uncharacterized protein G2W53_029709 [Senna tora]
MFLLYDDEPDDISSPLPPVLYNTTRIMQSLSSRFLKHHTSTSHRFTFTHRFVNQCCFDGLLLLYLCPFTVLQELKVLDLAERHGESSLTFAHVGLK